MNDDDIEGKEDEDSTPELLVLEQAPVVGYGVGYGRSKTSTSFANHLNTDRQPARLE